MLNLIRNFNIKEPFTAIACLFFFCVCSTAAVADGDETLGTPSITIASGTDMVAAGVGLVDGQPAIINLNVPFGVTINQVLIYWDGMMNNIGDFPATDNINVDGNPVVGVNIGHSSETESTYRADITDLGLIANGPNSVSIDGLDFELVNFGAGILVIIDDGSDDAIELRDGHDEAYINGTPDGDVTVPQTFAINPADNDRVIDLTMFFAAVSGTFSSGEFRPSAIDITISGASVPEFVTTWDNLLDSHSGSEWDTIQGSITFPAGADTLTLEAISVDNLNIGEVPASFSWMAAGLSVPSDNPFCGDGILDEGEQCDDGNNLDGDGCSAECTIEQEGTGRFTGGGHQIRVDGVRVTRGLTIHCDLLLSNNLEVNWNGNQFHMLEHLVTVECSDDPAIVQFPPDAPLDTLIGVGRGRYNGQDGFTIEFTLVDAGEPGREDKASLLIYETSNPGNVVQDVPLQLLDGGNLQAHEDQPHR